MNVFGTIGRPHFSDEGCWCRPHREQCECGEQILVHRQVELAPDSQERMAMFSDQRIEVEPLSGVDI